MKHEIGIFVRLSEVFRNKSLHFLNQWHGDSYGIRLLRNSRQLQRRRTSAKIIFGKMYVLLRKDFCTEAGTYLVPERS